MRTIILSILVFFAVIQVSGQNTTVSTPTIDASNWWNVNVLTKVTLSSSGWNIGHSFSIDHFNHKINLISCYAFQGVTLATTPISNTINIGTLSPAVYDLNYTVYISSNSSFCDQADTITQVYSFTVGATSVRESASNIELAIYPNPVDDKINIKSENPNLKIDWIRVIDPYGKEIKSYPSPVLNQEIEVKSLPEGVYFVKIEIDGFVLTRKLIKKSIN